MANLIEAKTYESGIYQIETRDPIIGGENGISNVQGKQLANRTAYLKDRADQVDAALGGFGSLAERLAHIDDQTAALGPEMQNAQGGALLSLYDQVGQALQGINSLRNVWQQEGYCFIRNRGVVSGCVVSKSATATRNLSISSGVAFLNGQTVPVSAAENAASVPSNNGTGSAQVSAFLYESEDDVYTLAVTSIGEAVPSYAIRLYDIYLPAGSTDAADPYLNNCILLDFRRIEPEYPNILTAPIMRSIPIAPFRDGGFVFTPEVRFSDGYCPREHIVLNDVAPNGVIIELHSSADNVLITWRISHLNYKLEEF